MYQCDTSEIHDLILAQSKLSLETVPFSGEKFLSLHVSSRVVSLIDVVVDTRCFSFIRVSWSFSPALNNCGCLRLSEPPKPDRKRTAWVGRVVFQYIKWIKNREFFSRLMSSNAELFQRSSVFSLWSLVQQSLAQTARDSWTGNEVWLLWLPSGKRCLYYTITLSRTTAYPHALYGEQNTI